MKLAAIAFRNLWRNTTRSLLSIGAITLASILGVFFLALVDGIQVAGRESALQYYTGVMQVRHEQFNEYDYLSPMHLYVRDAEPLRTAIEQIPGVTLVSPRINAPGQIYIDADQEDLEPGERHSAFAFAVDLDAESELLAPEELVLSGSLPTAGAREVGIGRELAEKIDLGIGDEFSFITESAERSANAASFEITAILNFPQSEFNQNYFLVPFGTMQSFLRMTDGSQQLIVMTADPENAEPQLAAVRTLLEESGRSDVAVSYWKEESLIYALLSATRALYDIFVIFFLLLGATVIVNTTMMTVFERYREIGVLGAMGMKPAEVVRLFFLESLFAGVISAVIGVAVGSAISLVLGQTGLRLPATYGELGLEMANVLYPNLTLGTVALMFAYTIVIPALVSLLPTRRAARIKPVEAINAA